MTVTLKINKSYDNPFTNTVIVETRTEAGLKQEWETMKTWADMDRLRKTYPGCRIEMSWGAQAVLQHNQNQ